MGNFLKFISFLSLIVLEAACYSPFYTIPKNDTGSQTKPFQFSPEKVTELSIHQFDPTQGEPWYLRVKMTGNHWEISSTSQASSLLDRWANETFILHVLDLFRTLEVEKTPLEGTLESFGLNPPRVSVQWVTPEKSFEFHLGSRKPHDTTATYFQAALPLQEPQVIRGAALRMLDMIDSYSFFRRKIWMTQNIDEIDEVRIVSNKKEILYGQREADQWTQRNHQVNHFDIQNFLNTLTSAECQAFIDKPEEAKALLQFIQAKPEFEVQLFNRSKLQTLLKLRAKDQILYGLNSSRSLGICKLRLELLRSFPKR